MLDRRSGSERDSVRGLTDIHDEACGQFDRLIREAFEAGRSVGRGEATAEFRRRVNVLFTADISGDEAPTINGDDTEPTRTNDAAGASDQTVEEIGKRASPGSVKPVIAKLVHDEPGLDTINIQQRTGFKHNSVRGTLWTLSATDKVIERRGDGWFPVAKKDEAAGANFGEETPTASNEEVPSDDLGLLTPDRSPQAAER